MKTKLTLILLAVFLISLTSATLCEDKEVIYSGESKW
jgi:hypothetical protein